MLRKMLAALLLISMSCFTYADPPAESGGVIRFQVDGFWDIAADYDQNITAVFGIGVVEFCSALLGGEDPTPYITGTADFMEIWKKDATRFHLRLKADMVASVWPGINPECPEIMTMSPLATGMVHAVFNDNDRVPFLNPDRNNMNTVNYNINGVLYSPTGEKKHFTLKWHAMWDGKDFDSIQEMFRMKLK